MLLFDFSVSFKILLFANIINIADFLSISKKFAIEVHVLEKEHIIAFSEKN